MAFLGFTSSVYLMKEATLSNVLHIWRHTRVTWQIHRDAISAGSSVHFCTSLSTNKMTKYNAVMHPPPPQMRVSSVFSGSDCWTGCSEFKMMPTSEVGVQIPTNPPDLLRRICPLKDNLASMRLVEFLHQDLTFWHSAEQSLAYEIFSSPTH